MIKLEYIQFLKLFYFIVLDYIRLLLCKPLMSHMVLLLIVNFMLLRITMATNLWMSLWGISWNEKSCLKASVPLWAEIQDELKGDWSWEWALIRALLPECKPIAAITPHILCSDGMYSPELRAKRDSSSSHFIRYSNAAMRHVANVSC